MSRSCWRGGNASACRCFGQSGGGGIGADRTHDDGAAGGDDRRFIAEQSGLVRILAGRRDPGRAVPRPHRPITPQWPQFDEKGLLGLAFHPDFASNGKFYVAYSQPTHWKGDLAKHFWWSHTNVIEEYTVSADDPDVADRSSVRQISAIDWPQFNHDGHWIAFGPDGFLYFVTGDGGYANDWGIGHNVLTGNGQDLLSPHGKMHRIDVNGSSDGQLRHPGRQSVRRPGGHGDARDLGLRPAQPVALLVRHGRRPPDLLRRRPEQL